MHCCYYLRQNNALIESKSGVWWHLQQHCNCNCANLKKYLVTRQAVCHKRMHSLIKVILPSKAILLTHTP